ncbi:MAG: tyrosine-type recombinase/integrase [Spirochaetia bacterium]
MRKYILFKRRGEGRDPVWYVKIYENGRRRAKAIRIDTGDGTTRPCTLKEEAEDYAELHYGQGQRAPVLKAFIEERHFFERGACFWILDREAHGHTISPNTIKVYKHALKQILAVFGEKRLTEIRMRDLKYWILALPCADSTKNTILGVSKILFTVALEEELIKESPTALLKAVKADKLVRGVFTLAELAKLFPLDRVELFRIWGGQIYAAFALTMATAGLRNAEARALQWKHYLVADRALLVEQQEQDGKICGTKGKRDRVVLIPDRTCVELDHWHQATPYGDSDGYMFPNAAGVPYHERAPQDWLRRALPRAGIDPAGRVLVPHSFRHTYVSHVRRSIPAEALGEMFGHSNEATTDGYDHPTIAQRIGALDGARDGITRLLQH